jgi:hypothetical protein
MDAARRQRGRKKKGRTAIMNERRRIVDRLLQQNIVHKEDKHGNVRVIPKYATINAVRNYFRSHPQRRAPKINAANRHRNSPGAVPSISTLRRDAIELRFVNYIRPRAPFRQAQKPRRFKFCKCEDFRHDDYVKRLLFSDEHFITTNDYSSRTQWVKLGKSRRAAKAKLHPVQRKSKYNTVRRMFWAMIGWNYKSQIIWCEFPVKKKKKNEDDASDDEGGDDKDDGKKKKKKKKKKKTPTTTYTLTGERYIKHILEKVKPKLQQRNMIFMQDGARSHTAKETRAWLAKKNVNVLKDWPANSPDLNPIEELWAEVNRRLSIKGVAHSEEELKRMVEEIWEEIPMDMINNYVMSFKNKTLACVQNKGGNAK